MKKITRLFIVLCTSSMVLTFAACKLETSDNGQLDGFWKLTRVDTLATGGVLDLRESGIFWSVQMNLISVEDKYQEDAHPILFRFNHTGTTLELSEPYISYQYTGDKAVDDVKTLAPFGINNLKESFTVETLNSSKLYLSTSQLRLSFTRF